MSNFQCENCGCVENSVNGNYHTRFMPEMFDWTGKENLKGKLLCNVCTPNKWHDGKPNKYGVWHNRFRRRFLPKGEYVTNREGNLVHRSTAEYPKTEDYSDTEYL